MHKQVTFDGFSKAGEIYNSCRENFRVNIGP
jgi:hypothetical protein